MKLSIAYQLDPERLARIQAHAARVQADQEYKAEVKQVRRRKPPKRDLVALWMKKIDRIDAMGSNWGFSQ